MYSQNLGETTIDEHMLSQVLLETTGLITQKHRQVHGEIGRDRDGQTDLQAGRQTEKWVTDWKS